MTRHRRLFARALSLALLVVVAAHAVVPALAQAHNPFGVGISEGGGGTTGLTGWLLASQGFFERTMAGAVKALRNDGSAFWLLTGLSFLYGVLHAAGPGHGKAVLAAYMVANTRALKRGIVLSFLAALLQAGVAILLVGLLSFLFHVTALGMREGAAIIEKASYCGIALLGAFLVLRKGRAFAEAWRARARRATGRRLPELAFAALSPSGPDRRYAVRPGLALEGAARDGARFACVAAHEHGPTCGHVHAPDPAVLGESFSWRDAIATVFAAGARPCSGAILVLVFAAAQGMFPAGIAATLVMALGTAITTAALAALAVLAKNVALRLTGPQSRHGALAARGIELAAACLVLAVGLSLLAGVGPLQALS